MNNKNFFEEINYCGYTSGRINIKLSESESKEFIQHLKRIGLL